MHTHEKHAYLLIVHKNQNQVENLLHLLDTPENDIFIHIDKKSTAFDVEQLKSVVSNSKIFFTERISVNWGGYSQIESELILLKAACEKGPYRFYHLLSGADLPLKPISEINEYFNQHSDKNFVHFCPDEAALAAVHARLRYYRIEGNSFLIRNLNRLLGLLQHIFRIKKIPDLHYGYGGNWFDINHSLATNVLQNCEWIKDNFYGGLCVDELFLQTLVNEMGFRGTCNGNADDGYRQIMRYIDFERGEGSSPYIFRNNDFELLMESGMFFARKFDEEIDKEIIDRITSEVCRNGNGKENLV